MDKSILSPSRVILEEQSNSKTGGSFWSSEIRIQGSGSDLVPKAPSLMSKITWKQARLRNLVFSGKILGIYSNWDHLHFPTSCHGNVPTLTVSISVSDHCQKRLFHGLLMMYSLESAVKAWMTFSIQWALMNATWWLALESLGRMKDTLSPASGKFIELSCVLRQTVSLGQCHIFKAKATLL